MAKNFRRSNEEVISELIEKGSVKEAAKALGYKEDAIRRRMKDPEFKQMYTEAKGEILKSITSRLQGKMNIAVDVLVDIMTDKQTAPQTRANCAATVLQYAARFTTDVDIVSRLEEIEAYHKNELIEKGSIL